MGSANMSGMGEAAFSFAAFVAASGWLRPARPGEGPGLVWDTDPPSPWVLPLPDLLSPPPDLPDLLIGALTAPLAAPFPDAPGLEARPVPMPPWPTTAPIPPAPHPGIPPDAPPPWAAVLPPMPPRPPIAAEPLFPAPVLAGGVRLHIAVPDGVEGVFHRPEVTDRAAEGLGWRITGGADAALFLMDPSAGTLGFLTPPDATRPGDADRDNVYELTFEVRDGWGAAATQRLLVAVTDAIWG